MAMTFGSLFAGIGGFDLGLERAGMVPRWQVENNPFSQHILNKHWPDVPCYGDIREVRGEEVEPVDIICGGFPCQDISNAGRRAGIEGARSSLWGEYARLVGELRPRYVIVENVAALRRRGLDRVLGDLAALGYDAEWDGIRASDIGAPTSATASGSWPTPSVKGNYNWKGASPTSGDGLVTAVEKSLGIFTQPIHFPTPTATLGTNGGLVTPEKARHGGTLIEEVSAQMWPTPTRSDGTGGPGSSGREGGANLRTAVQDSPTRGPLNPTWVEWLMGFPLGWTDSPDWATRSSRRSRSGSATTSTNTKGWDPSRTQMKQG